MKNGLPEGVFKVVSLEFRTGNAEDWNSYTLTCQIRFAQEPQEEGGIFSIGVRLGKGHFDVPAEQQMLILPVHQHIQVDTIPPDAQQHDPEKGIKGMIHHQALRAKHLRRPIILDRWLLIKIVAEENYFEFHFDDNFETNTKMKPRCLALCRFRKVPGWSFTLMMLPLRDRKFQTLAAHKALTLKGI